MIRNKSDYIEYLRVELGDWPPSLKNRFKNFLFEEPTHKFIRMLRHMEYHHNASGIWHKLFFFYYYYRYRKQSLRTGLSIPKNVCDIGLTLPHFGSIVVNAACRIGYNCMIQNNVNIGANGGSSRAPIIGNNVYIGPGAVIFGDIEIADNCYIGANSVVNKSVLQPYAVIVGVPAKVCRIETQVWWEKNHLSRIK